MTTRFPMIMGDDTPRLARRRALYALSLCAATMVWSSFASAEAPVTGEAAADPFDAKCALQSAEISDDALIYAAGGYNGRELDFQIDDSGHTATRMDVVVTETARPVVLLLGAYEPTLWVIHPAEDADIRAVVISGYHTQMLATETVAAPSLVSTYEGQGVCGFVRIYGSEGSADPLAQHLFGRDVEQTELVDDASGGVVVIGPADQTEAALQTVTDETLEQRFAWRGAPAGEAGLSQLLETGALQRASEENVKAWIAAAGEHGAPELDPFGRAYVVRASFTFPAGLYGAHAAQFFVPEGVPAPNGDPGHSTIYDFNTLRCTGVLCGVE